MLNNRDQWWRFQKWRKKIFFLDYWKKKKKKNLRAYMKNYFHSSALILVLCAGVRNAVNKFILETVPQWGNVRLWFSKWLMVCIDVLTICKLELTKYRTIWTFLFFSFLLIFVCSLLCIIDGYSDLELLDIRIWWQRSKNYFNRPTTTTTTN